MDCCEEIWKYRDMGDFYNFDCIKKSYEAALLWVSYSSLSEFYAMENVESGLLLYK